MSYLVGFVFGRGFVDFMNLPSPIYQAKVCFFFFFQNSSISILLIHITFVPKPSPCIHQRGALLIHIIDLYYFLKKRLNIMIHIIF